MSCTYKSARLLTQPSDDELGRGAYGTVKLAHHVHTGRLVAIKIVPREAPKRLGVHTRPRKTDERVKREIRSMARCHHPNVVQLYDVIDDKRCRKLFLICEYMDGGDIPWSTRDHQPALTTSEARGILRDVIQGLVHLHAQGVIHRDIKPGNILWTKDRVAKISDFGCAYVRHGAGSADDLSSASDPMLGRTAGTPAFFAPELCRGPSEGPSITKAIDVWALGVTMYCLLFGVPPFWAETEFLLLEVIMHDDYTLPMTMGREVVPVAGRAPRWPPRHEPEASESLEDIDEDKPVAALPRSPAMASVPPTTAPLADVGVDARAAMHLLDRLLDKDPTTRLTLSQAQLHPWFAQSTFL